MTIPSPTPSPGLSAHALACRRGDRVLFEGLSLHVAPGEWLHVAGENGAGKTSLLRLLAGLSRPADGAVRWNGVDIAAEPHDYRADLLYVGHAPGVKGELTALENLRTASAIEARPLAEDAALAALDRVGLRGREDLPVRDMSQGQRRRVALSRLLWRRARLWILDEPLAALDTTAITLVADLLREHLAAGGAAVLTSHQPLPLDGGRTLALATGGRP